MEENVYTEEKICKVTLTEIPCENYFHEYGPNLSRILGIDRDACETDAEYHTRLKNAYIRKYGLPNGVKRSLVEVFFKSRERSFTYYNKWFDVHVGDSVYVEGEMEEQVGKVVKVNTHFKICENDYWQIRACFRRQLRGTFEPIGDEMVSFDEDATRSCDFQSWIKADVPSPEKITLGDGYELKLHEPLSSCPDVEEKVLERAKVYAKDGHVVYLRRDQAQITAFVLGTKWYEVNCSYDEENDRIYDLYCECPYNGLCKHALAVALVLKEMLDRIGDAEKARQFTAIDRRSFWEIAAESVNQVKF